MTLILENGSGVAGANSNVDALFVSAYLVDRNRSGENGWANGAEAAEEDASCVAATDYIENKFRELFNGSKEFRDISLARSTLSFTANPIDTETVVVGAQTYTFRVALIGADDVLIGATTAESVANLLDAISANASTEGTGFGTGTVANVDASAQAFYGNQIVAFSKTVGTAGNSVATTTTVTGASWNFATLTGGTDFIVPQPLSFPRANLFDRDGIPVLGMADKLQFATAEYAVRARTLDAVTSLPIPLVADPAQDALGGNVTLLREKVGPIETSTGYQPGTANSGSLPSYPAADRLLREYIRRGGIVIR